MKVRIAYRRLVSTARKFEKMILLMLLFPEPLLPISKTFLFFAFLSCSDGGDSAAAATAGAGDEPMVFGARWGDGASISKRKMSSDEAMDGTKLGDEDEDEDEGGDGDGDWCRRLVRGFTPSTSVGNSHQRLESMVASVVVRGRK